jgi:hypothetical protein
MVDDLTLLVVPNDKDQALFAPIGNQPNKDLFCLLDATNIDPFLLCMQSLTGLTNDNG